MTKQLKPSPQFKHFSSEEQTERMPKMKCRICGGPVEGRVEFISVSLLCVRCCLRRECNSEAMHGCFYCVPERYALEDCGCAEEDLGQLQKLCLVTKSNSKTEPLVMYLRAEVRYLRNLRRKEQLEEKLFITLKNQGSLMRHFLLGDYLTEMQRCQMTFERIKERRCVLGRATNIVEACSLAHPDAVFEFCVKYPGAGPRRFQNLKQKMQQVFQLEGTRILHMLPKEDLEKLKDGPLNDVYQSFVKTDSQEFLKGYLKNWFSKATVEKIMADAGWKSRPWAKGPEDRIALKLKAFWKGKMERQSRLRSALEQKRLSLPNECSYCEGYLNGAGTYSLKEVVAIVALQTRLRKRGIDLEGSRGDAGLNELTRCMNQLKLGHFASVSRGFEVAVKFIETEDEETEDAEDIF